MRYLILLLVGICTFAAQADTRGPCGDDDSSGDCKATEVLVGESSAAAAQQKPEETLKPAVSPWQGEWAGSENSSLGMKKPVRAKITVTNGTVSGTWNAQQGLQPITGQVDGEEANITILQGGSMIKATLTDGKTLKYSGIRGYGTLTKQEKEKE